LRHLPRRRSHRRGSERSRGTGDSTEMNTAVITNQPQKIEMIENQPTLTRSLGLGVFLGTAGALALFLLAGCEKQPIPAAAPAKGVKDKLTPPLPKSAPVILAIQSDPRTIMLSASAVAPWVSGLTVASNSLASIPARALIEKRGIVRLKWDRSLDVSVTGYRVYFTLTGSNDWQSADVGLNTSATVRGLEEGASYQFQVVAYDANRIESLPTNTIEAKTPFYVSIFNDRWSVEAFGAFGKTNLLQATTNTTNWVTVLEWVGTATATNVLRVNKEMEFFRVEAK